MCRYVYLDHNILDNTIKRKIVNLPERLQLIEGIPVYSKENLIEIKRSKGREREFLQFLDQLGASYLEVETTLQGRITGRFNISEGNPTQHFESLVETLSEAPHSSFGLDKLLQKMYGGSADTSFEQIAEEGLADLLSMLNDAEESLDDIDGVPAELVEHIRGKVDQYRQIAPELMKGMGRMLDGQPGQVDVASLGSAVGVGAKQLKNIKPPKVLEQIWSKIEPAMPGNLDFEQFFGLKAVTDVQRAPESSVEKINAIYHALNFVGYFRDKDMKKLPRITASFSDMTHAGYASVCDWLFSGDEDLVRKAEAAYEFLKIPTNVEHIKA